MLFRFGIPPMPYYVIGGEAVIPPGGCHPARKRLGVFDWIVVASGTLYLTENGQAYAVSPGEAMLLAPDGSHLAHLPCREPTRFYWMHFSHAGEWSCLDDSLSDRRFAREPRTMLQNRFAVDVRKYGPLAHPGMTYALLDELLAAGQEMGEADRFREQALFQELFRILQPLPEKGALSKAALVAERAADYLRRHYREPIGYKRLGDELNYHPTYIARCMKQIYACTPLEYLNRYRLEKAKLLLRNTGDKVSVIAEQVGFLTIPYFTKCFKQHAQMSPSAFRSVCRANANRPDRGPFSPQAG